MYFMKMTLCLFGTLSLWYYFTIIFLDRAQVDSHSNQFHLM